MTHDDLEVRLARRLREQAPEPTWDFTDRVVAATQNVAQQRAGLTRWLPRSLAPVAVPASTQRGFNRSVTVLAAVALLVGLLAGAIAVGSGLVKLPSVVLPAPSQVEASDEATPSISIEPSPAPPVGLVVYNFIQPVDPLPERCTSPGFHSGCQELRIWVAKSDGTDAHELFPNIPGYQSVYAWSPDGASLLYVDDSGLVLTDLVGSDPQRPLSGDVGDSDVAFSPDGTRLALAYAIDTGDQGLVSTIAILDLATRQRTELESLRTHFDPSTDCTSAAQEGTNSSPQWSPDGTRLLVTRGQIGPHDESGNCRSIVFSVNADGSDFQLVVSSDGRNHPIDAKWSPDGAWALFPAFTFSGPGDAEGACDIDVIRPDGSDLRALTSDGISCWPHWTRDGRIVFRRWLDPDRNTYDVWVMDADGGNQTRLSDTSIAALTSVGCVVCPAQVAHVDTNGGTGGEVLWQPTP